MISNFVAALVSLAACGGGAGALEGIPATALAANTSAASESNLAATSASIQSATPVQLASDLSIRVDAALAGLGGGARWARQAAEGLRGDGWMEFILYAPSADDFTLHFQYVHPAVSSAALSVRVNEGQAQQILLTPTGANQGFTEAPALVVNLLSGRNVVRLQAESSANGAEPFDAAGLAISGVVVQRMQALAAGTLGPSFDSASAAALVTVVTGAIAAPPLANDPGSAAVALDSLTSSASAVPGLDSPASPIVAIQDAVAPSQPLGTIAAAVGAAPAAVAAPAPVTPAGSTSVAQSGNTGSTGGTSAGLPVAVEPAPANWASPRPQARIFITGHSLTDNPLGERVVAIANSLGGSRAARYNQQIVIGSPIRFRTDRNANWAGYSRGKNRDGSGMNVINELRAPTTLSGDRYDTLLIAENHNSLQMIQWEDTVRNMRHFHERFIAGNADGRSLFYETWFDILDKSEPAAWIAHERAQSKAWQCVVARVNTSLAAEGRADRITPLPAGAALVDLVERATLGHVPGVTQSTTAATINALLLDNVHLTPLGTYYMALLSYSAIYQRSPVGAVVPAGISSEAAASLQDAAWRFAANFYSQYREPDLAACRTEVAENFCSTYWTYRNQTGNIAGCRRFFGAVSAENPLSFDAASNANYWFAAP